MKKAKDFQYSLSTFKKGTCTQAIVAAIGLSIVSSATPAEQISYLNQGWDAVNHFREISYNLSQGSQLLPYDLFLALESYDSAQLVSSDNNIRRWGYLPATNDYDAQLNPDRLPVGFAKDIDAQDGNEYIGLTCAACHTGQIKYSGKELRIDGGQSLSDLAGLLKHLALSIDATINSPAKFKRLVDRLNIEETPENLNSLKNRLTTSLNKLNREVKNTETANNSGIGRIDAFGSIGNTILEHDMALPNNFRAPKAPVSFPYLWQTSNLERTQYTGIGENNFSRNVGEIIGVFSEVNLSDPTQLFNHNHEFRSLLNLL